MTMTQMHTMQKKKREQNWKENDGREQVRNMHRHTD